MSRVYLEEAVHPTNGLTIKKGMLLVHNGEFLDCIGGGGFTKYTENIYARSIFKDSENDQIFISGEDNAVSGSYIQEFSPLQKDPNDMTYIVNGEEINGWRKASNQIRRHLYLDKIEVTIKLKEGTEYIYGTAKR